VIDKISEQLSQSLEPTLVKVLLDAYQEAKRNFYLGDYRPNAVEGGRFCEAALRLLQETASLDVTPLDEKGRTEAIIQQLANIPSADQPDTVRLRIPRALRVVYDIRSSRNAVHINDEIDPNLQDATLVVSTLDWVLAEFLRLHHPGMSVDEAQKIVDGLVTRKAPVIQEFDGRPLLLRKDLTTAQACLVFLYRYRNDGIMGLQLMTWIPEKLRGAFSGSMMELVDDHRFVYHDRRDGRYLITRTGEQYVEKNRLFDMPDDS